ncbi:MAG: hypothetical protein A3G28_01800 [Betaproteobacteria bacterium RIFCSPLOWO2_12_FULL_68_19]|nr:MAG: hypothetical protein A3G28_01800 [Betaproteobacteria bacterium RIFCSPLOWO2_12_FULL_68_19]
MNRRAACRALLALGLYAAAGPALAQRQRKRYDWAQLTAEQQQVLAPLKVDWENLPPERRRKWIGIANRYPRMAQHEQERVQRRMQLWANLSPEQRERARANYRRMAKASAEKRRRLRQQWAEYLAQKSR